jgi:hypothetical protein
MREIGFGTSNPRFPNYFHGLTKCKILLKMDKEISQMKVKMDYLDEILKRYFSHPSIERVQNSLRDDLIDFRNTLMKNL